MAPNWMPTVNSLVNAFPSTPSNFSVMIMWPVEEMGRNSVIPSTMAMRMASIQVMQLGRLGFAEDGKHLNDQSDND